MRDQDLLKILADERKRIEAESNLSARDFRTKYGTFDHDKVAVLAAMRRAFQLGEES
jgi:hypothetical protein